LGLPSKGHKMLAEKSTGKRQVAVSAIAFCHAGTG
jgi:hypothetical protein